MIETSHLESLRLAPLPAVRDAARSGGRVRRALRGAFGLFTLWVGLAVVAAIPFLNLFVLGYFLEVQGRIARGARVREALPWLSQLPRLGGALVLTWAWLLPVRWLANAAADARWIAPDHFSLLGPLRWVLAAGVGTHVCVAWARGARARFFLQPWASFGWLFARVLGRAEPSIPWRLEGPPLRTLLWLGTVGATSTLAWLLPGTALMVLARASPGHPGLALLGGLLLLPALAWLPLLQVRFAAENRWRALFEWRQIRRVASAAPASVAVALMATYLFTLPLYLLKVVLPPSDAMWLATLVFVATLFPMRLWLARAYARAARKAVPAHAAWRWGSRALLWPCLVAYALLLFLTPLIDSHGPAGLFAQHALLLPAPF